MQISASRRSLYIAAGKLQAHLTGTQHPHMAHPKGRRWGIERETHGAGLTIFAGPIAAAFAWGRRV